MAKNYSLFVVSVLFLFLNTSKIQAQNSNLGFESSSSKLTVDATHLKFDGVDDRIDIALPVVFNNTTTNAFSVEAWIKPSAFVFSRVFFAQKDTSNFFSISLAADATIYVYLNNTASAHTTSVVSASDWTKVTVTKAATTNTILVYFNGTLQSTINGGSSSIGTNNLLTLGSRTNQGQFFNGSIDEVRVWDRVLSVEEIQNNLNCELATPTSQLGLVSYFKFNQGLDGEDNTGITSLTDSSVTASNGTMANFALTGTNSNWLAGSIITTGNTCPQFLSTSDFEIGSNFKIYPNPATSNVTIDLLSIDDSSVEVYNSNGQKVLGKKLEAYSNDIAIDILSPGIYFFKVNTSQGSVVRKVIKQ